MKIRRRLQACPTTQVRGANAVQVFWLYTTNAEAAIAEITAAVRTMQHRSPP